MCQEAILTWFRQILGISHGTTFLDLSDGIIVGKLLNLFKPAIFEVQDFQEINFVMNFARISKIVQNMLIFDNTLEPVTTRKIVDFNDDSETTKFVYNTIKIIWDWNLAKQELNSLRRDQIQYICDFMDKEEKICQSQQLLKKIIDFEQLIGNQEHEMEVQLLKNRQLEQLNEELSNDKLHLKEEVKQLNEQLAKLKDNVEQIQYLKQIVIDLNIKNDALQEEIRIFENKLEKFQYYEDKCKDLEGVILNQQKYCSREIIEELQQKNQILKEQVKYLVDCSKQEEIQELQETIRNLREQLNKPKKLNEQLQLTPKPPKPSPNKPSDYPQLRKQNQLLRDIINNLEVQSMHRRKSLNG